MPYIIAIVLVAVAALVFFSRPNTLPNQPEITNENVIPASEQSTEFNSETSGTASDESVDSNTDQDGSSVDISIDPEVNTTPPPAKSTSLTLSSEARYLTPARQEHEIDVTLNLENNIVTAATIDYNGGTAQTPQHKAFEANYKSQVVGKNINNISLSRVGGASLTSAAFNEAVAGIKAQL